MKALKVLLLILIPGIAQGAYYPKAWTTDCFQLGKYSAIADFELSSYYYTINGYRMKVKFFEAGNCAKLKFQLELAGNEFGLNDDLYKPGMLNHNLKYIQLLVAEKAETKVANESKVCGFDDWEYGVYRDVSEKKCFDLQFPKVNTKFYDFSRYQDDRHFFSWFPSFQFNTDPDKRPATVGDQAIMLWPVSEKTFNRVARDIKIYEDTLMAKKKKFEGLTKNVHSVEWVKAALEYMTSVVFYRYPEVPKNEYLRLEIKESDKYLKKRSKINDAQNTKLLKEILNVHGWITMSKFGEDAERDAFYLLNFSKDVKFQQKIINNLMPLLKKNEINKLEFADFYDLLAASYDKPSKRRKLLYGIQGLCKGEHWKPFAIEDEKNVDKRRAEAGMEPLKNHIEYMSSGCKRQLAINLIEPDLNEE